MPHARPRIALVTCRPQPRVRLDPDLPALYGALTEAGAEADAVCWDDPDVDWTSYDLAVIRSTWDYTWRADAFVAWAERCAALTTLANPPDVIRWNTDKHYLGDLAAAGVPAVETRYLAPGHGTAAGLPGSGAGGTHGHGPDQDGREYVIKPTTGAGGRFAARYRLGDPAAAEAARAHLAQIHARGLTAMVQPYMRRVDTTGERALVYYGGELVHAIRKGPVLAPDAAHDARKTAHPGVRAWEPTAAETAVAELALKAVPGGTDLLYARVDVVDDEDGQPCVMELELVEPNLFLHVHPQSLPTVVDALLKAAASAAG
ncbi:ATP-grasp domain-containing protein [Streptomyces odontomachi]|uniref:ATP-grasp domain-containing protein n=1 Tax=Streptomyces odontomachi TaxID=2944940 RepID=UPI00210F124A|nr:hypothetical protein [Streptomyces sp. ODS25]